MYAQVREQLEPMDSNSEASTSSPAEAVGGFYARNGSKNGMTSGFGRGLAVGWLLAERPAASSPIEAEDGPAQAGSNTEALIADISGRPVLYSRLRKRCTSKPSSLSGRHHAVWVPYDCML